MLLRSWGQAISLQAGLTRPIRSQYATAYLGAWSLFLKLKLSKVLLKSR